MTYELRIPPQQEEYIVSYPVNTHSAKDYVNNVYKLFWDMTKRCAEARGRELAEGPTWLTESYSFGVLECWPLVWRGE